MFTFKIYGTILIGFGFFHIVKLLILNNGKQNYISRMFGISSMKNSIKTQNEIVCIIGVLLILSGILFISKDNLDSLETLAPYTIFIVPYIYIWIKKCYERFKKQE